MLDVKIELQKLFPIIESKMLNLNLMCKQLIIRKKNEINEE